MSCWSAATRKASRAPPPTSATIGRHAHTIQADAGIPEQCERACRDALAFGPIDILINNIGGRRINVPVEEESLEVWQQMMDLNLTSTFLCTKLIGGAMLTRGEGGRVINIASVSGLIANRGIAGPSLRNRKGRGHPVHPRHSRRLGAARRDGECHPARRLHDGTESALGA